MSDTAGSAVTWWADGGDGVGGLVTLTPGLVLAAVIAVLVVVLIALVAAWLVWRRVRRSGRLERGVSQLRAATLPPRPRRELAGLRVALHDHLAQTQRVIEAAHLAPHGAAQGLLEQLRPAVAALDARLRLLEGEPDQSYLAQVLPVVRERVEQLCNDATALRRTALVLGQSPLGSEVLEQDLRDQIRGLQAGAQEIGALDTDRGSLPGIDAAPGPVADPPAVPRPVPRSRPGDGEPDGPLR